jgi:hypothetical protein
MNLEEWTMENKIHKYRIQGFMDAQLQSQGNAYYFNIP